MLLLREIGADAVGGPRSGACARVGTPQRTAVRVERRDGRAAMRLCVAAATPPAALVPTAAGPPVRGRRDAPRWVRGRIPPPFTLLGPSRGY